MRLIFFCFLLLSLFISGGCQSDSDYLLGTYTVFTTVQTSTCPLSLSSALSGSILPTGFTVGQTAQQQWEITRVAITGAGSEKIRLLIRAADNDDSHLILSGALKQDFFRIMEQQDIQTGNRNVSRSIVLFGRFEQDQASGHIHTFLQDPLASEPPCQITEHFLGTLVHSILRTVL